MSRPSLRDALQRAILVLDGAMGTMLQARDLTAADFGGPALEGCNEALNLTRPDVVRDVHAEYGLADRAYEIALAAARLAREAAGPRFVVGAMGPGTRSISVTRNVTFDEVREGY